MRRVACGLECVPDELDRRLRKRLDALGATPQGHLERACRAIPPIDSVRIARSLRDRWHRIAEGFRHFGQEFAVVR
jgi:hypothetical protein